MVFDDLSVTVSADTRDAERGLSRTEDALDDVGSQALKTGGAFELLERSVDGVAKSVSSLSRRSLIATGTISTFTLSLVGLNSVASATGTTLTVALLPAFAALSTTLAPLIAATGGLAAVLGSIAGIGAASAIGAIFTNTKALKTEFNELLATVKEEFAPLFKTTTAVILELITAFEQIVPSLVPAEDVIARLGGNFVELGRSIIQLLPELSRLATTLALEFLPPFVTFANRVLPRVPDLIRQLVGSFRTLLPQFIQLGRAIANSIPGILRFGTALLTQILPALSGLVAEIGPALSGILNFVQSVDSLSGAFGRLVDAIPVTQIAQALGGLATTIIDTLRNDLLTTGNLQTIQDTFTTLGKIGFRAITSYLQTGEAGTRLNSAFEVLTKGITVFADLAKQGLTAFANFVESDKGQAIIGNIGELFGEAIARTGVFSGVLVGKLLTAVVENRSRIIEVGKLFAIAFAEGFVKGIASAFVQTASKSLRAAVLRVAGAQARLFGAEGVAEQAFARAAKLQNQAAIGTQFESQAAKIRAGQLREQTQRAGTGGGNTLGTTGQGTTVNVTIEGELPEESIREVSVEEQNRRQRRNSGRTTTITR